MAPSARGVEIQKGSKLTWKIGQKLGSGACASVHSLETIDGKPTEYAVKVVPVPTKKTKKQNSEPEVNARLIYFEHLVYSNMIPDIRGIYVPKIPISAKDPPSHGEAGGYKFMTIERMDCEISQIVPILLKTKGTTINFGPIAVKLLECIQAIQDRKQIVVDVKAENFMLTCDKGTGSTDVDKLASRIRLLDLALLVSWKSIESHRENEGTSGLAGTPLYASINVHQGQTPSRRDDLESIGYVISELVMKLVAGDASVELPWSNGKSDEDIGKMKEENMNDPNSAFFNQLGGKAVVKVISDYMNEVRGYSFKKTPDYESLKSILSKLKIPKPTTKAPARASTKARASVKKTPLHTTNATPASSSRPRTRAQKRASPESESENEVECIESPAKMARDENSMDVDMEWTDAQQMPQYPTPQDDSDDDSYGTAPMDFETTDENEEPAKPAAKPSAVRGVTVLIETGPHKGKSFNMIEGQTDKVVVGRNPSSSTSETPLAISNEDEADDSHIRMELAITKKLIAVRVFDLKSTTGTFIGKEKIKSGKDYRIFRGDSVRIGDSLLTVKQLDPNAYSSKRETAKRSASTGQVSKSIRTSRSTRSTPEVIEVSPPSKGSKKTTGLKRVGVQLVVTQGPHKGESYEIESGGEETLIIGKNPSSSVGTLIKLSKDNSLNATHMRVDLNVAKKLITVSITDKSKGGTQVNNSTINKGRAFINDIIKIGDSVLEVKAL